MKQFHGADQTGAVSIYRFPSVFGRHLYTSSLCIGPSWMPPGGTYVLRLLAGRVCVSKSNTTAFHYFEIHHCIYSETAIIRSTSETILSALS